MQRYTNGKRGARGSVGLKALQANFLPKSFCSVKFSG